MSDAHRQSALLLHAIGERDRAWILAQLAEDQRMQLTAHLEELSQMGMPADHALVESLLSRQSKKPEMPAESIPGHALRSARPEVVLKLLDQEPAWLIAAVLNIEAWPWREAICAGFDASKRDRVKQALRESLPEKLGQALAAQLEARLPRAESELRGVPLEPAGQGGIGHKFRRMVRAWL